MSVCSLPESRLGVQTVGFYRRTMETLKRGSVDFLVGGAYAYECYTGIARDTKDFDLFVRREDRYHALETLAAAGYRTEMSFPHWLGKAHAGDSFIDVIFGSGNGIAIVDEAWFEHAVPAEVFGDLVKLCPPEEMIWSKAFIMERERFDGADVAHLIHARAEQLDWARLLARFGDHWRVLLSHLVLFGFIYPCERRRIPSDVMNDLVGRLHAESVNPRPAGRVCQGTILSRAQYLPDLQQAGYEDARLVPRGAMTADDIALWTSAIE